MSIRSWTLRNLILPAGDAAFRHGMIRRLRFLEQAQWWDSERIEKFRRERLAELTQVAYREVPFYRDLMNSAGLRPEDLRRPEDLPRLPMVSKPMLRARYPHDVVRDTGLRTYEARTSGSTGTNFAVREDSETAGYYRASLMLSLAWTGWQIGDEHIQSGITPVRNLERRLKDRLLRCHYVSAYDTTDASLDGMLGLIERRGIRHVWGYPCSMYLLARRARQLGWNQPLRAIATWGDTLYPQYRKTIEEVFGVQVYDTYGCGEGIQIAAQCGHGPHYHTHEIDGVVEFVDDAGQPVAPGQPGHVLLTRFHPGPMPLIRYRVGDSAVPSKTTRCACGRHWSLMDSIQGRDTDVIVTPEGNRLIVHFFTGILEFFDEIDAFQVVQKELESMHVRIVLKPGEVFTRELEQRIIARLQERGAMGIKIYIEPVDEIPLSKAGKRRFVMSEVALR